MLAHKAPRPFGLAVAARARRQAEGRGRGRRVPPRDIAHFYRTAELDRHDGISGRRGEIWICSFLASRCAAVTRPAAALMPQRIDFAAPPRQESHPPSPYTRSIR